MKQKAEKKKISATTIGLRTPELRRLWGNILIAKLSILQYEKGSKLLVYMLQNTWAPVVLLLGRMITLLPKLGYKAQDSKDLFQAIRTSLSCMDDFFYVS